MGSQKKDWSAIVLSGGGTRGAYEAGVIHYMRTKLPPAIAEKINFNVHCGSSVGAINASWMAATCHDPKMQGRDIVNLWANIRTENIYRSGPVTLGKLVLRSLVGITSHMLGIKGLKRPGDKALHFQGFFDTRPFFAFLRQELPWPNISKNIESGLTDALMVTATNMSTGLPEIFLQKRKDLDISPRIIAREVKVTPRHVMASAALPVLFPPVPILSAYYNDGGLRLNTPLAPAVTVGAKHILIIGTQHRSRPDHSQKIAASKTEMHYPSLGEVLGKVFHSILLDRLIGDRNQVNRINRVLDAVEKHVSPDVYQKIREDAGVRRIKILSIFPSIDIATLVDETIKGSLSNLRTFSSLERAILRLLETDPKSGTDFLSYFLFEPIYLRKLIDLGYEDARAKHDELIEFGEAMLADER